jgi:hypothetical protein
LDELEGREEDTWRNAQSKSVHKESKACHTDEGNTWWVHGCHELAILGKVLVAINGHLARSELRHVPLANLFPSSFQATDGRRVQTRGNRDHTREVVQRSAALDRNRSLQRI